MFSFIATVCKKNPNNPLIYVFLKDASQTLSPLHEKMHVTTGLQAQQPQATFLHTANLQ